MPSGYTAKVASGEVTDLRSFALICARGMGALISMRDEPFDAKLPEKLEPSSYHREEAEAAEARVAELRDMSLEQIAIAAAAWNAQNDAYRASRVEENSARRARYEALIAQTEAWQGAPDGLKRFMLSQLRESMEFDVRDDPLEYAATWLSDQDWLAAQLKEALWNVECHEREHAAEVARTAERNAWLQQLYAALPPASF